MRKWCKELFGMDYSEIVRNHKALIAKELNEPFVMVSFTTLLPLDGFTVEATIRLCTERGRRVFIDGIIDGNQVRSHGRNHSYFYEMEDAEADVAVYHFIKLWMRNTDIHNFAQSFRSFICTDWLMEQEIKFVLSYAKTVGPDSAMSEAQKVFGFRQPIRDAIESKVKEMIKNV